MAKIFEHTILILPLGLTPFGVIKPKGIRPINAKMGTWIPVVDAFVG
tara:strand:+ start:450 stop:590 length:141 start_codon:yes stop_codon:yes gene_type:complete